MIVRSVSARSLMIAASLLVLAFPATAQKWVRQYFYDENKTEFEISSLAFPSANRGIAVGTVYDTYGNGKPKYISIVTSDGGAHWKQVQLKEFPRSIFFLNDSQGWMVTSSGLWFTEESGLTWKKIGEQIKPNKKLYEENKTPAPQGGLLIRVWFLDVKHGFGVGLEKAIFETTDGGVTWKRVEIKATSMGNLASNSAGNPVHSAYTQITFADGKRGLVVGGSEPPRRDESRTLPAWMDPERASKRRQVPTLTLMAETTDGGSTWNSSTAPLFGTVTTARLIGTEKGSEGILIFTYNEAFEIPSEVYRLAAGQAGSVYRGQNVKVTDAALFPGPKITIAGVEPTGKMHTAPVPGKVKVLESTDYRLWHEMPVDYKAVARNVVIAGPDSEHLWIGTDTGMILKRLPAGAK